MVIITVLTVIIIIITVNVIIIISLSIMTINMQHKTSPVYSRCCHVTFISNAAFITY